MKSVLSKVIKIILLITLLILSSISVSEEIKADDWLLWYKVETQLPFSSALTIYPPVNLYAENGALKGAIATPYSLSGHNNRVNNEFLIIVTDAGGNTHFLKPKLKSVGFVNDLGISLSSLSSNSFQNGNVLIQLYKFNSAKNRQELQKMESSDLKRQQGIDRALANIKIPQPTIGKVWPIMASTLKGQNLDDVVSSSHFTIIQLYSAYCAFCKKAISSNNALNESDHIKVIGISGTNSINAFKKHLSNNEVHYAFIAYEGEYTEPAILKATGVQGFPTYLVLDSSKKVHGIFVGTHSLENWLAAHPL